MGLNVHFQHPAVACVFLVKRRSHGLQNHGYILCQWDVADARVARYYILDTITDTPGGIPKILLILFQERRAGGGDAGPPANSFAASREQVVSPSWSFEPWPRTSDVCEGDWHVTGKVYTRKFASCPGGKALSAVPQHPDLISMNPSSNHFGLARRTSAAG
jgi:hypothetical protein